MDKGRGRGIARTACTLGLAVAVGLAGMPMEAVPAWAASTGTLEITAVADNEGLTYEAYRLFGGTVKEDDKGDKELTGVGWDETTKNVVEAAIKEYAKAEGHTAYSGTTAQDAADYLAGQLAGSDASTVVGPDSLVASIAQKLVGAEVRAKATFKAGEKQTFDDGYYLVVTQANETLKGQRSATAPVCTLVGAGETKITEKTSVPTLTKEVQEDSTGDFGDVADAQVGQLVTYRLTATLPSNYESYEKYHLKFVDYLSKGLTLEGNAKVWLNRGGKSAEDEWVDIANSFSSPEDDEERKKTEYTDGQTVLIVDGANLKKMSADGEPIAAGDTIVVEYTAKLNEDAVVGSKGNPNKAKLVYSNNPLTSGEGTTEFDEPRLYTYQLNLLKRGQGSEADTPLAGAEFTLKLTAADGGDATKDTDSVGKYVSESGTLVEESAGEAARTLKTDDKGSLIVKGLDAGTYQLVETKAPDGYTTISGSPTITISPDEAKDGVITATLAGVTNEEVKAKEGSATGQVDLTVHDPKNVGMPQTGSTGFVAMIAGGASLTAVSLAALLRRRTR